MLDALYPLFSIFAFLGFLLMLVPLPWHLQAWNSGTCFYMMWVALACLNQFVNSVAWKDNVLNNAPVWCDISIRITMGASVGIPAASLCINRRLYQIASVKTVSITPAEKRRAAVIDALLCVLFPLVYVALQYIVQDHRFIVYEQIGCYPALYNSIPMYLLSMIWPPLLGLASSAYGALALRAFLPRRAAFTQFLSPPPSSSSSHASGLTSSRYLRLMALALTAALLTTFLGLFAIYLNLTAAPLGPWRPLADTHFMFSHVEQIPSILWRGSPRLVLALEFSRWASPACALIFFAFFGFAVEARRHYALFGAAVVAVFWRGAARVGVQRPASGLLAPAPATSSSSFTSSKGGFASSKASSKAPLSAAHKPISNPIPVPIAVGLPTYSFDSLGSFTDVGTASPSASSDFSERKGGFGERELNRAGSSASASSAVTSRFVERFEGEPETPATATSFSTFASTSTETHEYALPLHVAWHDAAYPASPASSAYPYIVGEDGEHEHGEEAQWSPVSDAHSIWMDMFPVPAQQGRTLVQAPFNDDVH
ncbi:pheromone A receptor-domain-containing protein [Mycena vulgaris]|nr:pheromone A receptor-domain-containing protein [Mycena vulgaris]